MVGLYYSVNTEQVNIVFKEEQPTMVNQLHKNTNLNMHYFLDYVFRPFSITFNLNHSSYHKFIWLREVEEAVVETWYKCI